MTAIMDLSFPGQRTATATSCIPHNSVYMPGPCVGKSEYGFFCCDTWLRIFQNDYQNFEAEVTLTPLINKICKPGNMYKGPINIFPGPNLVVPELRCPKGEVPLYQLHVHVGLLILNLSNAWLTRLHCSQSAIFSWDRRGPLDFQMYRGGQVSRISLV